MSSTRRSFLALVAAALAAKPEELLLGQVKRPGTTPNVKNPVIPNWWQCWTVCDEVEIRPGEAISEVLFSAPIPRDMLIASLRWLVPPQIPLRDLRAIIEQVECRLSIDGRPLFAGPMIGLGFGNHEHFSDHAPAYQIGASTGLGTFHPAVSPHEDLRLEVVGNPKVSEATKIMFAIDGSIKAS